MYGIYTVLLAGKSPNLRSYTVCIYATGHSYIYIHLLRRMLTYTETPYIVLANRKNDTQQVKMICTVLIGLCEGCNRLNHFQNDPHAPDLNPVKTITCHQLFLIFKR